MARDKKNNNLIAGKSNEKDRWHSGLKEETKRSIWGIICFGFSIFLILSIFNRAGIAGDYLRSLLVLLFGKAIFLAPIAFILMTIALFVSLRPNFLFLNLIGGLFVVLSSLTLVELVFAEKTGGYIGFLIALPFLKLFDFWASAILFSVIFIVGILVMFNIPFSLSFLKPKPKQQTLFPSENNKISESTVGAMDFNSDFETAEDKQTKAEENIPKREDALDAKKSISGFLNSSLDPEDPDAKNQKKQHYVGRKFFGERKFQPAPLDLFEGDKGKPSTGDIKANANIIKRTFQTFGIAVEMNEVCIGPSVTQYTLKPAEGVKLSRITALNNDLSLALATHPIRIEAPIPGKSLVGIEVPNRTASLVSLKQLLSEGEFQNAEHPLTIALGRNVAGRPIYASIAKMPHLLIAGSTGSGKSVSIHTLIMSLLFHHAPWELQFLMIDPKRVELTMYNDLPYLLNPVIIDAKKAVSALKWATKEMERRYDKLLEAGSRDIFSYLQKNPEDNMPYIVIIIDELADIMATYPREFEASIVRLAQMSRAVGIHLVVSTQRPSVEVITGLIKANITSRVAFQVASQVDSRTILDMAGAEKLLGNGDMLYLAGDTGKPRRIQGAFVSEKEVKKIVSYLVRQYEDLDMDSFKVGDGDVQQTSMFDEKNNEDDVDDDLYEEVREMVIQTQKASTSYLQRRLRVGYSRAARLLDMLEERGVIGPADGPRTREVLIKSAEQ
ncbi:MAG: DNA translocase FtsK 4TM domain-containing protein [bacterium]|nr:DNA translocase FtsK 4TM domain-containing protein [bacterium]